MKTLTLFLLLWASTASVQGQHAYQYEGSAEQRLYERMERDRRQAREEAESMRDYGWEMDYLRLENCAKYNNGCAREFYGRDWP